MSARIASSFLLLRREPLLPLEADAPVLANLPLASRLYERATAHLWLSLAFRQYSLSFLMGWPAVALPTSNVRCTM